MSKVAMASEKLDFVGQGVQATSSSLNSINTLIQIQAENEGIPITTDNNPDDLTENEKLRIKGDYIEREGDHEVFKEQS
jgi:hypothetical protein